MSRDFIVRQNQDIPSHLRSSPTLLGLCYFAFMLQSYLVPGYLIQDSLGFLLIDGLTLSDVSPISIKETTQRLVQQ